MAALALPVMIITLVALVFVHPDWSLRDAQFAWMLLILFSTIAIAGAGMRCRAWCAAASNVTRASPAPLIRRSGDGPLRCRRHRFVPIC